MDKRKLGKTELEIAPLVFGGNVFGWTANEATSFALLDAFIGHGFNAIDTADVYSRWVPGKRRRRVRDDHRQLAEEPWQSRSRRHRHQGRIRDGAGQERVVEGIHHTSGRGLAAPSPDRHHRSLSLASARSRHGDRRSRPISASSSRARSEAREDRTTTLPDSPRRLRQARPRAEPATRCCNPSTISASAPATKAISSNCS
jgi:Aldo/keto reductase family